MLTEKSSLSCELSDKGELIIRNTSNYKVTIWSVEVWFSAHMASLTKEDSYSKKVIRDVLVIKRELSPGEIFQIDLGVTKRNIAEIKVHYSLFGRFEVLNILPE